ncbi:DNA replication protein DnaC [Paraburkholderia sp. 35.1]
MTRMTTKTKAESSAPQSGADSAATLRTQLMQLHLAYTLQHYEALASEAAAQHWSHVGYLARLVEGEAHRREDRSVARRVALARFPVLKTLDQFEWNWPTKINRLQVQNLFRLNFIEEHANVIFLGGVGLGKSHLSIALGHTACLRGYSVLFATAVDIINSVNAACAHGGLRRELRRYAKPRLLIIDELGYLPIDQQGADILFQIVSQRYEHGATIITSNRAFKHWPDILNHDSTLTSALLDRVLHHAETVVIEGKSYRMKDQSDPEPAA